VSRSRIGVAGQEVNQKWRRASAGYAAGAIISNGSPRVRERRGLKRRRINQRQPVIISTS